MQYLRRGGQGEESDRTTPPGRSLRPSRGRMARALIFGSTFVRQVSLLQCTTVTMTVDAITIGINSFCGNKQGGCSNQHSSHDVVA
jgi:hypothetical protein